MSDSKPDLDVEKFRKRVAKYLPAINRRVLEGESHEEALRAYHAVGRVALELIPDRAGYAEKMVHALAQVVNRNPNWVYKVRDFAQKYTEGQLDELCAVENISWGHAALLLSLKPGDRRIWLKKIKVEKLQPSDFRRRLQKRNQSAKRHYGGRPPKGAMDPHLCLERLIELNDQWQSYCRKVIDRDGGPLQGLKPTNALKDLKRSAKVAAKALDQVAAACRELQESPPRKAVIGFSAASQVIPLLSNARLPPTLRRS